MLIDGVNHNAPISAAAVNANTIARAQKILDAISQSEIDALKAEVSELKTQQVFFGVPNINPCGSGAVPSFINQCGCACVQVQMTGKEAAQAVSRLLGVSNEQVCNLHADISNNAVAAGESVPLGSTVHRFG